MVSTSPTKKRKAESADGDPPGNDDDHGVVLSANLSLADLNRLIDQRVADAVRTKTVELDKQVDDLQRENEGLLLKCESLERSVKVLQKDQKDAAGNNNSEEGQEDGQDDS